MSKLNLINRWKNLPQPLLNHLTCKVCNYQNTIEQFKIYKSNDIFYAGELIRYQCPNCNVIFGDLRFLNLNKEEISKDYVDLYSYYSEGDTSKYILHCLDKINLGKDKVYLDYACGNNIETLNLLNNHNYNVYGHDAYVNNIHTKFIKNLKDVKNIDIIYSSNYIEHVIEPFEDLQILIDLLNDNGKLVLISGCWEYKYEISHYHTFFFLGKSLKYLCEKLKIREVFSEKIFFEDGQFTTIKIFEKI